MLVAYGAYMRIVMAFGSFDVLHPGHISYLRSAKKLGDRLIVIVARDKNIMKLKHINPIFNEKDRVRMVGALRMVDKAELGNKMRTEEGRYAAIKKYKPSLLVFGYDQEVSEADVEAWLRKQHINAKIVRMKPSNPLVNKSSKIKKALMAMGI